MFDLPVVVEVYVVTPYVPHISVLLVPVQLPFVPVCPTSHGVVYIGTLPSGERPA